MGGRRGAEADKEALHEMNGDTYLPSSDGNKDFVDDDDYYGKEGEHKDEENDNDDDEEEEWNLRKQDKDWDVWKHGSNGDLYQALECPSYDNDFSDTSFENIHTVETWHTFNRIYNEVIAATKDTDLEQIHDPIHLRQARIPVPHRDQVPTNRRPWGLCQDGYPKGESALCINKQCGIFQWPDLPKFHQRTPAKAGLRCDNLGLCPMGVPGDGRKRRAHGLCRFGRRVLCQFERRRVSVQHGTGKRQRNPVSRSYRRRTTRTLVWLQNEVLGFSRHKGGRGDPGKL